MKLLTLDDKKIWDEGASTGCHRIRFNHYYKRWVVLDKDPCPGCPDKSCDNAGHDMPSPHATIIIRTKKEGVTNEMVQS